MSVESIDSVSESPIPYAFPIGEFVRDELLSRGWTISDAVERLGEWTADKHLWLELICCTPLWFKHDIAFSIEEAHRLETIFGASASMWMKLHDSFLKAKSHFSTTNPATHCGYDPGAFSGDTRAMLVSIGDTTHQYHWDECESSWVSTGVPPEGLPNSFQLPW